jgi:twinkle protein
MTGIWDALEARGLGVERLAERGWAVETGRDGGEVLSIPFVRSGISAGEKYRRFSGEPKWMAHWVDGPIAYNEDCLRDPSLFGQPLIVTEGEMDCEAALVAGYAKVISVPNGCGGASGARQEHEIREAKAYQWFAQIEPLVRKHVVPEIILATDGDDAGNQLLHELAVLFGKARCKFLKYPRTRNTALGRERLKDLNEVLVEYGPAGVVETINRAQFMRVEGVFRMSELPPLPPQTVFDGGLNC